MGPRGYSATNPSSPSSFGSVQELVGTAIVLEPYAMVNGVPVLKDGTPATNEEVEANEDKIIEQEKRDYLAQHMILSTI